MRIYRFLVSKQKFLEVPANEQLFLIYAGYILNELNTLNRLILFAHQTKAESRIEREARISQLAILLRIVVGKLCESWHCLRKIYFATGLSVKYETSLDEDAHKCLKVLKKHFGKKSILDLVRNKFSFHYSIDEVAVWLKSYERNQPLQFNLGDQYGNSLFTYAEEIVMNAALDLINPKSSIKALENLLDESNLINKAFCEFFSRALGTIVQKYFGRTYEDLGARRVQVKNARRLASVKLPCFISKLEKKRYNKTSDSRPKKRTPALKKEPGAFK